MRRDARKMPVIWGFDKAKYFFSQDWTGSIRLMRLWKLVFWRRRFGSSRGAFEKWIDDAEAADGAAVLHVLAKQRVATGFDGGNNDQGIIE